MPLSYFKFTTETPRNDSQENTSLLPAGASIHSPGFQPWVPQLTKDRAEGMEEKVEW